MLAFYPSFVCRSDYDKGPKLKWRCWRAKPWNTVRVLMCDVNTQFGDKTQRSNGESHRPATVENPLHIFVAQTHHKIWISCSHLSLLKCYHSLDLRVAEKKKCTGQKVIRNSRCCLVQTHVANATSARLQVAHITSQPEPMIQNINKARGFFFFVSFQLFHLKRDT